MSNQNETATNLQAAADDTTARMAAIQDDFTITAMRSRYARLEGMSLLERLGDHLDPQEKALMEKLRSLFRELDALNLSQKTSRALAALFAMKAK